MPKRATKVILSEPEQAALVQATKRHRSEQQQVLRARIVLAAAQGRSNVQIARDLAIHVDTVCLWRDRWAGLAGIDQETLSVAERLQDAPRPGAPPEITAEQRCQMAAIACEARLLCRAPNQPVDWARNCRRVEGAEYCGAYLPPACFLSSQEGGYNRTASGTG